MNDKEKHSDANRQTRGSKKIKQEHNDLTVVRFTQQQSILEFLKAAESRLFDFGQDCRSIKTLA